MTQIELSNEHGTHMAEIVPGKSIRLFGVCSNRAGTPKTYDITFKVGDTAEYDSYNLSYLGKIVSVGQKTVTIKPDRDSKAKRLKFYEFGWRNRDFDLAKIQADNANTMMYI